MLPSPKTLSIQDHSRASAGLTYVYPVLSRRAGGISLGINLNPNNACNWHCVYCQVENLTRGSAPTIDLRLLQQELDDVLDAIQAGSYFPESLPQDQRRLVDIAFSGNGEPTSAKEFPQAIRLVAETMTRRSLLPQVCLRLITNGSLVDRRDVRSGLTLLSQHAGEVWFKVDAVGDDITKRINGVRLNADTVERRLRLCGELCSTWVQTCLFAYDGNLPTDEEIGRLLALLERCRDSIRGVHLYGLARPSAQPKAGHLARAPDAWLHEVGKKMRDQGLIVRISP